MDPRNCFTVQCQLTSDLVLEAVGEGVAEDEAVALLHRRRLPGHGHAARGQRVALRELWRRPGHCNGHWAFKSSEKGGMHCTGWAIGLF